MIIKYSNRAKKFLKKQTSQTAVRIIKAINELPEGDVIKLQGVPGFRLRVGTYRIIFDRDGNIIDIIDIDNRGQVYKRR